jgi:hypothetical protein
LLQGRVSVEQLRKAISAAWDEALKNKRDNEVYAGYSIGTRSGKNHRGRKRENWQFTYLVNISGLDMDFPPGDNYHKWGWQEDTRYMEKWTPALTQEQRDELVRGMIRGEQKVFVGPWVAEAWR